MVASRAATIGAVEYDYKSTNQNERYMHVQYSEGRTVRMSNYEKFKKERTQHNREKRNVENREERIIGGEPVSIKVIYFKENNSDFINHVGGFKVGKLAGHKKIAGRL